MEITEEVKIEILSKPFFKGRIKTGSMVPVINIGDEITVEVKAQNLSRFDIIVFAQNQILVCHYLWNLNWVISPRLYQTRSMMGNKDMPFTEEQYIGRVISHRISWWRRLKIIFQG